MNYVWTVFMFIVFASQVFAGDIIVTVDRFTQINNNAPVRFSYCTNEDDHRSQEKGYRHIDSELIESTNTFRKYRITSLQPGEYSLAAYHDLNNNEILERLLKIPQEPIGFSMIDITRMWGHPQWKDVRFQVAENETQVNVHLICNFGVF